MTLDIDEIVNPEKRDTSLRHLENHGEEAKPQVKNEQEWRLTYGFDEERFRQVKEKVKDRLLQQPDLYRASFKTDSEKKKIAPLLHEVVSETPGFEAFVASRAEKAVYSLVGLQRRVIRKDERRRREKVMDSASGKGNLEASGSGDRGGGKFTRPPSDPPHHADSIVE